jgi:hypothetical protein
VEAGDAGTTITGTPELDATNQKVNVVMGAGNDLVHFNGDLSLQQLSVNLGAGNDLLEVDGTLRVLGNVVVLHQGSLGATPTTATLEIATQAGQFFEVGADGSPANFTYVSTGLVNDTLNLGLTGEGSRVTGAFTAMVGPGSIDMNVQVFQLGSMTIVDQTTSSQGINVNVAANNINGDARIALGRGSGGVTLTNDNTAGDLTITNVPAVQNVSVTLVSQPRVEENFTVTLGGKSATLSNDGGGVLGNVSITNRATQSAVVNTTFGTITGSTLLNAVQPAASGATAVSVTFAAGFIQGALRSTTAGPGNVHTSIEFGTITGDLTATSRGKTGSFSVDGSDGDLGTFNRVGGNVRIIATGGFDAASSDFEQIAGNVLVTVTGSTFAFLRASSMLSANVLATGSSVARIDADTVTENLTVTLRDFDSSMLFSTDNIGGNATVTTTNTTTTVELKDVGGNLSVTTTGTDHLDVDVEDVTGRLTVNSRRVNDQTTVNAATVGGDGRIIVSGLPGQPLSQIDLRGGSTGIIFLTPTGPAETTTSIASVKGPATFSYFNKAQGGISIVDADQDVTVNIRSSELAMATLSNSVVDGNLRINQFGLNTSVQVFNTPVAKDLIQRNFGKFALTKIVASNVVGTTSFSSGIVAGGIHDIQLDDSTFNNVVFIGGAARTFVRIETDENFIGTGLITGNLTATLGGGNDDVQFGDVDEFGQPSLSGYVTFGGTSLINLNGGLGSDRFFEVNSDFVEANLTLISIDRFDTPPP